MFIHETIDDRNELKANRFAAEFLVDEELLRKELRTYSIDTERIRMKDILKLADLFSVPYRTMVKRLNEINILTKTDRIKFLDVSEDKIKAARKRYAFSVPEADERITIDDLTDLAVDAYENQRITFEKLEYLLGLSKLNPEDVDIAEPVRNAFPSDSELDDIMEE